MARTVADLGDSGKRLDLVAVVESPLEAAQRERLAEVHQRLLLDLGAPADLVRDIRERRYAVPVPISQAERVRRGEQARAFVRHGIRSTLAMDEGSA